MTAPKGRSFRAALAGAGAFAAAFVASSHHSLHMLLVSLGLAGSSFVLPPALRWAMVALSVAMAAFAVVSWRRSERRPAQTAAVVATVGATALLLVLSVVRGA